MQNFFSSNQTVSTEQSDWIGGGRDDDDDTAIILADIITNSATSESG